PSMTTALVMIGSVEAGGMTWWPGPMGKGIMLVPGGALASGIACRRGPGALALVVTPVDGGGGWRPFRGCRRGGAEGERGGRALGPRGVERLWRDVAGGRGRTGHA